MRKSILCFLLVAIFLMGQSFYARKQNDGPEGERVSPGTIAGTYVTYKTGQVVTVTAGHGECNRRSWEVAEDLDVDVTGCFGPADADYYFHLSPSGRSSIPLHR